MKWIFLAIIVAANCTAAFVALAPGLVTYAEVPPKGITCNLCGSPEIQSALTAAATYGRGTIIRQIQSWSPWILAIAFVNVTAFSLALFVRGRSNNNLKSDAAKPRTLG